MEVQVFLRAAYGKKRIYPADDTAKMLASFGKRPSFTQDDVELLKKLGFTFKVVQDPSFNVETL